MTSFFGSSNWFSSYTLFLIFEIVYSIWIFSEIINNIISAKNSGGKRKDKGSYWVVISGIFLSIIISFIFREENLGSSINNLQIVGICLIVLGILIREWAIFTLGKGFTVKVHVQEKGKLIMNGPYKIVRHPSYTGSLLALIGLPLALGTWLGAIILFTIMIIVLSYRINVEEKALLEAYGEDYKKYMKKTRRLIPGVY
ncbi:MAG TPA: isoprenylcysteine carboxylmethyltransferase family protein [Candidatus Omnitrophota bacterium]|nr:isoprenylcysteine carboxylmethyltransferase family protein [Candidatus Omnitrophota bacterium]